MSAPQNVIVKNNLGTDFAFDNAAKLIHVNVDGTSVLRDATTGIISAIVGPSVDVGDILTVGSDGRPFLDDATVKAHETVTTMSMTASNGAIGPFLEYTNEAGAVASFDLSGYLTNLVVAGGTYDAASTTLTLAQQEGDPITVNLGDLSKTETIDTSSISFTGDGSLGHNLAANLNVSGGTGNAVVINADGIFVPAGGGLTAGNTNHNVTLTISAGVASADIVIDAGIAGNMLVAGVSGVSVQPVQAANATDGSLSVSVSGTASTGQTVTGSVNVSATTPNMLVKNPDGLFVSPVIAASGNGLNLSATITNGGVETITGYVVADPAADNLATVSSTGVLVSAASLTAALFNLQLTDAFGAHLGWLDLGTSGAP